MKKVINRKVYDTKNARLIAKWSNGYPSCDFNHKYEVLYLTQNGAWFIHGQGGALSSYATSYGRNKSSGEDIFPLTKEEALEWLEKMGFPNEIAEHFSDLIEEA